MCKVEAMVGRRSGGSQTDITRVEVAGGSPSLAGGRPSVAVAPLSSLFHSMAVQGGPKPGRVWRWQSRRLPLAGAGAAAAPD